MKQYKVGVIGTGFGAKVQVPALQSHERFDPVIIAGTKPDKTSGISEDLGIEGTSNWKDLLSMDLDLVVVSTPPYLHYQMARAVIDNGFNLLLEKPTTTTALEAKELCRSAEDQRLVGMLSHEFRWVPERAYLHDLLQDGAIGNIREIYLQQYMNFGSSNSIKEFGWFWNSLYEGGILGAVGSHLVDYIRYITEQEFSSVKGTIKTLVPFKTDEAGYRHKVTADTGFNFSFELEDNTIGSMTVTSTLFHPPPSKLVIGGDEGTIILENGISMAKVGEVIKPLEIPNKYDLDTSLAEKDGRIPPYLKLLDQVARSLDHGVSYSPSLYDGWKNQQVLDAIKSSSRTGSNVHIVD